MKLCLARMTEQERAVNLAKLAVRNLRRRPMRSVLLICSIGLAMATALTLVALSHSIENGVHEGVDERGADLTVTQRDASDIFAGFVSDELEPRIAAVPGVKAVAGELAMFSPVEKDHQLLLLGWTENSYFWKRLPLRDGRLPNKGESHVVIIGEGTAETLKKTIGDSLDIYDDKFLVVGVAKYASAVNRNLLILPLADLQDLSFRKGQVTAYHLEIVPNLGVSAIDRIKSDVSALGRVSVNPTDQLLRHDRNIAFFNAVSRAISIIALTMVGLSLLNVLLMAVQERTREIGIMMAIGWSDLRIMASIVTEGVLVGICGCALGIPLGYAASFLFSGLPTIGNFISFKPSLAMVWPSLVAAMVLCVLGSLYPAWRAVSLSPADALRRA
jgi:putative ABC transport system permease protein